MLAQSAGHSSGHTAKATGQANAAQHIVSAHPYVQAAQNAISQHAAQHVLNIVHQSMAQHHAASHAAAHHAAASHVPVIHLPHLGPAHPHDPTAQFLANALAHETHASMQHPQYPEGTPLVMNQFGQWVPTHAGPGQMVHPGQGQSPYGPYQPGPQDNGTDITTNGGGGGFMSLLMQAMGQ